MNVHLEVQTTHPQKLIINLIKVTSIGAEESARVHPSIVTNAAISATQCIFLSRWPSIFHPKNASLRLLGGENSCNLQFCVCLLENSLLALVVQIPILNLCVHTSSGHNDKDEKEPLTTVIPSRKSMAYFTCKLIACFSPGILSPVNGLCSTHTQLISSESQCAHLRQLYHVH